MINSESAVEEFVRPSEDEGLDWRSLFLEEVKIREAVIEEMLDLESRHQALLRKYQDIIEKAGEGFFQSTPDGKFITVNAALVRIFGYSSPDEMKTLTRDIQNQFYVDPETRNHLVQAMLECGEVSDFEVEMYRKDRSKIWVSETARAVRDEDGQVLYFEGMIQDVTQKRQAKEEMAELVSQLKRQHQNVEADLSLARGIQTVILPMEAPIVSSEDGDKEFLFYHEYLPAEQVSGDFIHYIRLNERCIGVFICDVIGHGVRAALVTALLHGVVEHAQESARDPGRFLEEVNKRLMSLLSKVDDPVFATACYVVADVETGRVQCATAGHPPPMFARCQLKCMDLFSVEMGPMLCLDVASIYKNSEAKLEPGDRLILYTDGLFEVENAGGGMMGVPGLMREAATTLGLGMEEQAKALVQSALRFGSKTRLADDVCLATVEWRCKGRLQEQIPLF